MDSLIATGVLSAYGYSVINRVNPTPVAIREGQAFPDSVFGGLPVTVDHADVPHAVFGTPEVGAVGLTEETARYQIDSVKAHIRGKMRKAEFWLAALIDKIVEGKKAGWPTR